MISVHFQGKPFNMRVFQVSVPSSNAEEVEVEWFYEDLQDLLELTPPQKRCSPFQLHQMSNDCTMVDLEFLGNLCSCKRISFDDPFNLSLSTPDGWPLHSSSSSLLSFEKLLEPPLHCTFVSSSWAKCMVDVVSCLLVCDPF